MIIFRIFFLILSNITFWLGVEKIKCKEYAKGGSLVLLSLVFAIASLYWI